jgi:integrase/recombinase XerD
MGVKGGPSGPSEASPKRCLDGPGAEATSEVCSAARSSLSRSPRATGKRRSGGASSVDPAPGAAVAGLLWCPSGVVLWVFLIGSFQRQCVDLPSGVRYWSVVDERFELVRMFDAFLFEERVSRDRSEKTTGQYASNLVEFASWAHERELLDDLMACARNLGMFQLHLRTSPIARRGRGHGQARSNDRVGDIMSTVRSFYRHQVRRGTVPGSVNRLLYDVVEPAGGSMPWLEDLPPMVARPLDRLPRSGVSEPQVASLDEYVAMMGVARSLRDKLLITILALSGLRIGQALGVHRSDVHLMANSRAVGCSCSGPHVHIVRRENNANLALSKRRRELVVPAHPWVVGVYAAYCEERDRVPAARLSDFVFVNLAGGELGRAMRDGRAREIVAALGRRAGIGRVVTPHQFRHGLGTELVESGRSLDEVQMILGHAHVETTRRYAHTSRARLRDAIESVSLPSTIPAGTV